MSIDNISTDFDNCVSVSTDLNDTTKKHPRFSQYKNNYAEECLQEKRRIEFFELQKRNRQELLDKFRKLIENDLTCNIVNNDECETTHSEQGDEKMDVSDVSDANGGISRRKRKLNRFKNQLMLSEWLVDVPNDFTTEWYMVICPIGKRCLVVSSRGETKVYAKNGYLIGSFPSLLPGGNRKHAKNHKGSCILDCIFSEINQTYYILDLIWWNSVSFHDSETEFRFFWLDSKFTTECSQIGQTTIYNKYKFLLLNYTCCDEQSIQHAIKSCSYLNEIDGLLFYHKKAHYSPGRTPLVCWLKLEMLSKMLMINIDQD